MARYRKFSWNENKADSKPELTRLYRNRISAALLLVITIFFTFGPHEIRGAEQPPLVFLGDKDYPPVAYLEDGAAKGMDVDLATALGGPMKRTIRIELMDWNLAQEKVLKGEADGLLGLSISDERKKTYDFADPTFTREFGLVVRSGDPTIRGLNHLNGKNVGVTSGGFPRKFLEGRPGLHLVFIDNYKDGFDRLLSGTIDAIAADMWVAAYVMEKNGIHGVTFVGRPFAKAECAIAVTKGNSALLEEINQAIKVLKAEGKVSRILDDWRPLQMLFVSREKIRVIVTLAVLVFLVFLLAVMGLWIMTLKKQVRIRRTAESALRESEERFRNLTSAAFEGIAISENGRLLDVNDQMLKMFHYERHEIIGKQILELIAPESHSLVTEAIRTGRETIYGHRLLRKDGSSFYAEARAKMVNMGTRILRMTALRDITDRKQAEEALKESETRLRTLTDASFEGIGICKDGILMDANDQLINMLGYTRSEIIDKPIIELVAPESRELVRHMTESGQVKPYEHLAMRKDGTLFPVEVCGRTIATEPHRIRMTAVRDITARVQAEAALRQFQERELRAREEFAQHLLNAQEKERRRIASELHDSLGQNLLLIKNRAQLALTSVALPPQAREQIEALSSVALEAITEVRQISRDLHPYQLDQLGLKGALEVMIKNAATSTTIVFEYKLDSADDVFQAEAAVNVYRVVQECLNNVLKHANAHRAFIGLERDLREVRFWVTDDGKGFPLNETRNGFGLRNIAERVHILKGRLRVDSSPGQGTRIGVVVPIRIED